MIWEPWCSGRLSSGEAVRQLLLKRYGETKDRTGPWFAFRSDMPTHQFNKLFADGQSQPSSAIFPGGGPVSLHKRLE